MERRTTVASLTASKPIGRISYAPRFEFAAAGVILAGIALAVWRFGQNGYLPQPFYFRVYDSLMDLYTTAYWANTPGAYTKWMSLYPPISFVFLKVFTIGRCYAMGDIAGRSCDWLARFALLAFFVANIALVYATYRASDRRTAVPRTVAMALGLPMLYAIERGNLLVPCFTFFAIGFGGVVRRPWLRWLALAISINFKPYLVFSAAPFLAKRYWSWVIGCGVFSIVIYVITLFIFGSGWPSQIIGNQSNYSMAASKGFFLDVYYATSYWPLIRVLHAMPAGLQLASGPVSAFWSAVLTAVLRGAQLGTLLCAVMAALRPAAVDARRFGALLAGVALTGFTTGSAGYAQIFLFFLVFFERWRGPARIAVLGGAYLLCVPFDIALIPVVHERVRSFLGGREVTTAFGLSVGQILRPGVLLVMQYGLIALNLADSLRGRSDASGPDGATPSQVMDLTGTAVLNGLIRRVGRLASVGNRAILVRAPG